MSRLRSASIRTFLLLLAVFCLAAPVFAQTPTGDVVISANTAWPTASYSLTSLSVQNGAVLTIGGGSTVSVTGSITVTGSSSILLQSTNTTTKVNGTWQGVGVTLNAGSVQVDTGSSINADAQGYVTNAGPGAGLYGSGGSYGGVGGYNSSNPALIYGSAPMPVDLGSGGGAAQYDGSNGGGAIRLIVSGTLTNNGTISANGEQVEPARGGAGSGGSVYVTTATLAGSGSFTANGGSNPNLSLSGSAPGGGGRVAIYYANATGFTGFNSSTASAGAYPGTNTDYIAANGTAAFFDTSGTNNKLSVYQAFTIPASSDLTYGAIALQNRATLTIGGGSTITITGGLSVTGNSTILLLSTNMTAKVNSTWQGVGVTLNAGSVQVDAGSSINADAQGYVSNAGPGAGNYGSGGSYGGVGGYNSSNPALIYGSAPMPMDLGSGGGAAQYNGSNGGGAIRLIVSGTLTNNGIISANGEQVEPARGGGGSGGSVYVTTATLAGSGSFTANGGSNPNLSLSGSAPGGGGRVAIYYANATGFTGFTSSTASAGAYPGTNTDYIAANGTAAFFDTTVANNNVTIYQGYVVPANTNVQFNSMTLANGAALTLGGGSQLAVSQALRISGTVTALASSNTALVLKKWKGKGVTIAAASLQIDATGSINADAQGYLANVGPGAGSYTTGGSYGGAGGGQPATSTYGSALAPIDIGSGGGSGQNTGGGSGGGAIELLISGDLTNNGVISANGGSIATSGYGAGGSGGSVFVETATLQGSGSISANGGSNTLPNNAGSGGGGGRISVNYLTNAGFSQSALSVNAGTGATPGSVGTTNFVQTSGVMFIQPSGSVVHGQATVQWFTDTGVTTTVTVAGPQSSTLATGPSGVSSTTWDTTAIPDGIYELRLTAIDSSNNSIRVSKTVIVNNSVQWFSGTLTSNTHWTAGNVYAIDSDLIVPAGITLTIDPGTVVKAIDGSQISVQSGGTLIANGDPGNPVIFTTFDDSSVGGNTAFNQGVSIPSPGAWLGVIVSSGGTFTNNGNTIVRYAQQALSATLTTDTTLLSTQVYEISSTLNVSSGTTLTIQPGAVIKFDSGAGINVQPGATLIANGTLTQPIYFTSINDNSIGGNTNGNSGATPPAPGDWNSIVIDGANASFNHVQMQYGGGPANSNSQVGMIETGGASTVTIANSVLAYSYYIGLQAGYPGGGDTVTVTNSTFYGIQDRAINTYGGSTVHVINDTFDGNAQGIFTHGGIIDVANSIVSNSTGTRFASVEACCGGSFTSFVNTDVYSTASGVVNYAGITDPTGTSGNISVNPVYMSGALHDYRPTYGSPAIDAGSGTVANYPATDSFGISRYNSPLVTAKTGTPDSNGKYPDMGAFEFVQAAPSDLDLTVSEVQGPSTATVGDQVQLTWTVTNVGTGTVYGPWHDAVYLVTDPSTNPVEALAGQMLEGAGVILGPGASYTATATVSVPGATSGPHSWEVKTNVRGEIFEGANTANNKGISANPVSITVPQLVAGAVPVSGTFTSTGQSLLYQVTPSASQTTSVQLALASGVSGSVQIFVGGGYVPSPQHYDYEQVEFNSPTASVVIPSGSAQNYYVTAYAQALPGGAAAFTIQASTVQFSLTSVSPNSAIGYGNATLTFIGGGFTTSTIFNLIGPDSTVYNPTSTFITDSDHAQVTFTLGSLAMGSYAARASSGTSVTLANALQVGGDPYGGGYNGSQANQLQVTFRAPQGFRAGFPSIVSMDYTNNSGSDMVAPLIYLSATNATLTELPPDCRGCDTNLGAKIGNAFTSGLVLGINREGPAGVLPAGSTGSISFVATPAASGSASFYVAQAGSDILSTVLTSNIASGGGVCPHGCAFIPVVKGSYPDGSSFCSSFASAGTNALGLTRSCMALLNNAGFSYLPYNGGGAFEGTPIGGALGFDGFNQLLAADATALSKSGIYEYDVQSLLGFELQKDGLGAFNLRYHQGAFGFGRSHPFDITLANGSSGPTITYPDGTARIFPTLSSTQANAYLGPVGDYGFVTLQNDSTWLLTDADGTLSHFIPGADGYVLDYLQDRDGNRTTLTYTNNLVSSVNDAFGNRLSYQYDSLGHITQVTDAAGRTTNYSYNILDDTRHSTFLTSVTSALGTTSITWNQGGASGVGYISDSCVITYCEPAIGIASIAYPDGTHRFYTYDSVGRLAGSHRDDNAEAITYTYNSDGSTTATDALGHPTTTASNQAGLPAVVTDPFGSVVRLKYDAENKLTGTLGPLGDSSSFDYDQQGNPASACSPEDNLTTFNFTGAQRPASITDPSGNATGFNYDSAFNLTALTYPNGQQEKSTYDASGRILTHTNRRGNTVTFAYGDHGLLASKTYSNNSQVLFAYDNHFNLQTVTGPNGTIRYTYDAADRVTGVSNSDGTSLTLTYNSDGQRSSMRDSTGFTTNYAYDQAGRLASLKNGAGVLIVSYTYDANGRVASKQFGNGTSTSLSYDFNGKPLSVINASPGHGTISEYDYTYDAEGQTVSVRSPNGNLTYGYDLDGELTTVVTPAGNIQYSYDPSGNRTNVTINGASSNYQVNNLNEYTAAGGANYQYDTDGNMTYGNGWTYTYNDDNKLLTMVNANDSWSFQYDGLGNRTASIHNGKLTRYLIDPAGYGNITAEFDNNGAIIAHYIYGLGLTSSVQASGVTGYYHFDAIGNTTQITTAAGAVANSYIYLPFGEQTVLSATIPNPFTYNGQLGVRDEGTGLYLMRNRWYNPSLGRFQQEDPIGYSGGQNYYKFADNSPTNLVDPLGLFGVPPEVQNRVTPPSTTPSEPANAPLTRLGDSTFGHVLNAIGGELPGGAAFVGGTSSNILTVNSFANAFNSGDTLGVIHDGTLAITRQIGLFLPEKLAPGPLGVLQGVIKHIGAIDEASQAAFNHWLIPYDPRPDGVPLKARPSLCGKCLLKNPSNPVNVPINSAIDPNAKITSGFGDQGFIPAGSPVTYTIFFENQATATAPAQRVTVTDALSSSLDWSTVQFNQISINNSTLNIPDGTQTFSTTTTVTTDPNPVSVKASLNPATGTLTWTMQSVDAVTGGLPANPLAGFLPPDDSNHAGTGYVTFTVKPKQSLADAATIANQASIVFDANAAIATNTVTNTIDASKPTSAVAPLPASTDSRAVPVSWSGSDPAGSGVAYYNLYVAVDKGAYALWLSATTLTSSTYTALPGHSYSFYSLATDNVGVSQATPATSQTILVNYFVPSVTVTPASSTIASGQPLTVTVTVTATSTPTGTITLTSAGYTSAAAALANGVATVVIPAGALTNGIDTITATYAPDDPASAYLAASTGSATVNIGNVSAVQVTVGAAGAAFSVDGTPYSATQTFSWIPGSNHTIATTSPQTANGTQQTFTGWSDGGALSHTVTPITATTYTAAFSTSYLLTTASTPQGSGTVSPVTGTYYPAGTMVNLSATPASGYNFASWTGAVASASSATTTVSMNAPQTVTANFNPAPPTFSLGASPATRTVTAGSDAIYTISASSLGGAFTNTIALTATGLPSGATATFLPSSLTPGASGATSVLTIHTPVRAAGTRPLSSPAVPTLAMLGLISFVASQRRRRLLSSLLALILLFVATSLIGCGTSPKVPQTYTITINGTSGSSTQMTQVSLVVQ
jgi:RHS repeat-associated protein